MNAITNTSFDGTSYQDMQELGHTAANEGGEYYTALIRHQLAERKLRQQLKKDGTETPLTDTWDSKPLDTKVEHRRAPELQYGKVQKKKDTKVEPTVRLRKAMGLPLRKGEPLELPKK